MCNVFMKQLSSRATMYGMQGTQGCKLARMPTASLRSLLPLVHLGELALSQIIQGSFSGNCSLQGHLSHAEDVWQCTLQQTAALPSGVTAWQPSGTVTRGRSGLAVAAALLLAGLRHSPRQAAALGCCSWH